MSRGPWKNVTYEFVPAPTAVSLQSGFSYLVWFWRWELGGCRVVFSWNVVSRNYSVQLAVFLCSFSLRFVRIHVGHPLSSTDIIAARKKIRFIYMEQWWKLYIYIYIISIIAPRPLKINNRLNSQKSTLQHLSNTW